MASKRVVTLESLTQAERRSAEGRAPIDISGEITLVDESDKSAEEKKKGREERLADLSMLSASSDAVTQPRDPAAVRPPRSASPPTRRDDLSAPPKNLPRSPTHSTLPLPEAEWSSLDAKSSWLPPRKGGERRGREEDEGWGNIKHAALPAVGWAEVAAQRSQQQQGAAVPAVSDAASAPASAVAPVVWSDADFVELFPHLRSTAVDVATAEAAASNSEVTPVMIARALVEEVAAVRKKFPELEKLHYGSTHLKVRKWRELLGATRAEQLTEVEQRAAEGKAATVPAPAGATAAPVASSSVDPPNALHHRFHQPDLFLTKEQVSSLLMRQRELLYVNIERVIVPRLSILRAHLRGVNLSALILRNPALLLSDLHVSLPLKLRELRALFPEINIVSLIEQEASILSRSASSFLVPRLNLFARVSGYAPRHVVQFLAVEHPEVLAMRWNRLKRLEIVREERFWEWWRRHPLAQASATPAAAAQTQQQQTEATVETATTESASPDASSADTASVDPSSPDAPTAASSSSASPSSPSLNDPSTLPFALYHELVFMTSDEFGQAFPWFNVGDTYTTLEQELFAAAQKGKEQQQKAMQREMEGKGAQQGGEVDADAAATPLGNLTPSQFASVPGHPQPLSLALGASSDSLLTRDELRAKQRMDYLALKAAKKERASLAREYMREREKEHQQRKMQEYTQKFQAYRNKAAGQPYQQRGVAATQEHGADSFADAAPRGDAPSSGGDPTWQAWQAEAATGTESAPSFPDAPDTSRYPPPPPPHASSSSSSYPSASSSSSAAPPRRQHSSTGFDESSYPAPKDRSTYMPRSHDSYGDRRSNYGSGSGYGGFRGGAGRDRDDPTRDRSSGRRGGFQPPHQKNRAGLNLSSRHQSHPQGVVESFGARPTPITEFGKSQFQQGAPAQTQVNRSPWPTTTPSTGGAADTADKKPKSRI